VDLLLHVDLVFFGYFGDDFLVFGLLRLSQHDFEIFVNIEFKCMLP
jgi:hypothetical protein